MPSKIPQIQFRNADLAKSLKAQNIDPNQFFQSLSVHIESQIENGKCPVCGKFFDDCEYFKSLEDE